MTAAVAGPVVWVTGLPASGKTSVSMLLAEMIAQRGARPVTLDGDRLRPLIPMGDRYDGPARLALARTYAGLAGEIAVQGHPVVCSTVSLFHEVHRWNRANIANYVEVLLSIPADEQVRRATLRQGGGSAPKGPIVGREIVAQMPESPDLLIDTTTVSAEAAAGLILARLVERGQV